LTANGADIAIQDYHDDGSEKAPRYHQVNAINATIEAIAKGQDRVLLVMATGTGKTYTAFQIIWRFRPAYPGKRVLFLADRNVRIDETMVNDFRPFAGKMAKLSIRSKTIERADGSRTDVTSCWTGPAGSTPPTRSTWASTRRSLGPRTARSLTASSRRTSST
jgi:type I restriction enzyme R subunit